MRDIKQETLTNIVTTTGVPLYGQGRYMHILSAGMVDNKRFGFEFLGGLSGNKAHSSANKNHFTLDGKLYKLGAMDIVDGMNEGFAISKTIKIKSRDENEDVSCKIVYNDKYGVHAGPVNAVVVLIDEQYRQGTLTGKCKIQGKEFTFENVDTFMIYDQGTY